VTARDWTTRLSVYTKPPMSLNDRTHWRVKAKHTREIRDYVREWAWFTVPACSAAEVELHYVPRDRRRRDLDNLIPTLKPAIDGLVDAGVVPDDTPEYVRWTVHIDAPDRDDPHLYVVVREKA
jgi:crossover junction endodeoxyribonuclease RusA